MADVAEEIARISVQARAEWLSIGPDPEAPTSDAATWTPEDEAADVVAAVKAAYPTPPRGRKLSPP